MPETNQYGLTRYIPADVRALVRNRSGFGCVICAESLCEYEHFSPEFSEASTHSVEGITLLCPTCHGKKSRKFLTNEDIAEAVKSPETLRAGLSTSHVPIGNRPVSIRMGESSIAVSGEIVIFQYLETKILSVKGPDLRGGPALLSAKIIEGGQIVFEIDENTWQVRPFSGDFEAKGGKIIVRDSEGKKILDFDLSERGSLRIKALDIELNGFRFRAEPSSSSYLFTSPSGVESGVYGLSEASIEGGVMVLGYLGEDNSKVVSCCGGKISMRASSVIAG